MVFDRVSLKCSIRPAMRTGSISRNASLACAEPKSKPAARGDRDGRRRVRIVEIAVQCQAQLADRGAVDDDGEAAVIVIRRRGHDVCRGIAAKRERGDGNAA